MKQTKRYELSGKEIEKLVRDHFEGLGIIKPHQRVSLTTAGLEIDMGTATMLSAIPAISMDVPIDETVESVFETSRGEIRCEQMATSLNTFS